MIKLLLIDDDEFSNSILTRLLQIQGFSVETKTNGSKALEYLLECKENNDFPDAMLIDIQMPVMDGFTFLKNYEKEFMNDCPPIQAFILSNSTLKSDYSKAAGYTCVREYISKPLTTDKIKILAEKLTDK